MLADCFNQPAMLAMRLSLGATMLLRASRSRAGMMMLRSANGCTWLRVAAIVFCRPPNRRVESDRAGWTWMICSTSLMCCSSTLRSVMRGCTASCWRVMVTPRGTLRLALTNSCRPSRMASAARCSVMRLPLPGLLSTLLGK